jgi:hypothetical protein
MEIALVMIYVSTIYPDIYATHERTIIEHLY